MLRNHTRHTDISSKERFNNKMVAKSLSITRVFFKVASAIHVSTEVASSFAPLYLSKPPKSPHALDEKLGQGCPCVL